jgi:hypothetical protein
MNRFNTKIGAAVLVGLAVVYMGFSLALGRNARAERPQEVRADEAGLDVWKASAFLVREPGRVAVIDVRPADRFALYNVPGSVSAARATAAEVMAAAKGKRGVLIVADADKDASALVAAAAPLDKAMELHFLKDGARAWYLAYELPVAMFTEAPPPHGYEAALTTVKRCVIGPCADAAAATDALIVLSRTAYEPTLLQGRKPAAAGGAKKKISGGCGG